MSTRSFDTTLFHPRGLGSNKEVGASHEGEFVSQRCDHKPGSGVELSQEADVIEPSRRSGVDISQERRRRLGREV